MPLLPLIFNAIDTISKARARHQTERIMRSLPLEIQKDIGWPNTSEPLCTPVQIGARNSLGLRAGQC